MVRHQVFTINQPHFLHVSLITISLSDTIYTRIFSKKPPQRVGSCPGHHVQLIDRSLVIEIIRGEPPPPLKADNSNRELL